MATGDETAVSDERSIENFTGASCIRVLYKDIVDWHLDLMIKGYVLCSYAVGVP